MGADKILTFVRRFPIGKKLLELAGGFPTVIQWILGLSAMTALSGFFGSYPYVAMACGAVFAYYAMCAFIKFEEWWRKNNLDHKISYSALECHIEAKPDSTYVVRALSQINNSADFDILISIEYENCYVNEKHARRDGMVTTTQIIPKNSYINLMFNPIENIKVEDSEAVTVEFSIRFGKDKKNMTRRWFVKANNILPPPFAPRGPRGVSFKLLRNDFEMVVD
jgi:hypothetical protein